MVLSELREPTLELLCERCGDRGRFGVTELLAKHGDAKLADLAVELARCPRVRGVSDCLACQAGHSSWRRTSRAFALRRTRSLWASAVRTAFFALPASVNLLWNAAKSASYRRTISATTKRMERTVLRPPLMDRLPTRLPVSWASGARPTSLLMALAESSPISGNSAIRRATVRSATPLIVRKSSSSLP